MRTVTLGGGNCQDMWRGNARGVRGGATEGRGSNSELSRRRNEHGNVDEKLREEIAEFGL